MNAIATELATDEPSTSPPAAPLFERRKRRSWRSWIWLGVVAAGVVGWPVWQHYPRAEPPPSYTTAPAAKMDVIAKVTATGTLSPVVQVEVGSQISGRIAELHADYNSVVQKGDVLARLDSRQLESALASAKARLSSAYAELQRARAVAENATSQYQRTRSLTDAGAVSRAEADAALATKRSSNASVKAARAAITVAEAGVQQAELDLAYTTITSPIDGVVVSRSVDVGQTVAASLSAPVLFVIAEDLRNMEVHTSVAESDVGRLQPGMDVELSVDAYPTETFHGTIKQVRYEATTVSNVVTYNAVVAVDNAELKLRPGMTANVAFIIRASRDVLAVSNKAFTYRPAQSARGQRDGARMPARPAKNMRRLLVLRDNQPTMVRVQVGMTDGTSTEITGGELAQGDLVIIGDDRNGSSQSKNAGAAGNQRSSGRRGPPRVF